MNDVERITWEIVSTLIQEYDPARDGWAIDAGLGNGDYYCEWTNNLGYKSMAVEPAPTDGAVNACEVSRIPLVSAALGGSEGVTVLYSAPERDLRSLRGDLWGGMEDAGAVEVVTLPMLLRQYGIEHVTLLKLDIEGAEPEVIETLIELDKEALPGVICFEFGGEGAAEYRRGPWSTAHQKRVREAFKTLRRLGYKWGVLVGSGDGLFVRGVNGIANFSPADNWGNAIMTRFVPTEETIGDIPCLVAQNNEQATDKAQL